MRRYLQGFLINHEKTVCICVRETGTDRDGLFSFVLLTAPVRWNGKKRCCYPMSFPFSIRRTLSCHLSKVERWPMLMTVVPGSAVRRRYIFSSVSSSIALVASSRKTHFGFLRNTRQKPISAVPLKRGCGSSPPRYPAFPLNGKGRIPQGAGKGFPCPPFPAGTMRLRQRCP